MAEFAQYYLNFLQKLLSNIGAYFSDRWKPIANIFTIDIPAYFNDLVTSFQSFGIAGWIAYILVMLVNFTCIFFLLYRLVQLLRRFIFFRAKEVVKDELMEELAKEKQKTAALTIEKNQLYALKVNSLYPVQQQLPEVKLEKLTDDQGEVVKERFAKLCSIDREYKDIVPNFASASSTGITLEELVDNFCNFAASQLNLYYTKSTIRQFFAGMATTNVIIIEGISGTGKTSLPYAMGKFFNNDSTIVSVQPSWRDRSDLLGYLNEFTKTFNETDFLGAVYSATYREEPSIIILDEMNLSRIEYYFAEFLSIMEMPDVSEWTVNLVPTQLSNDPRHLVDGSILVPQRLWFVGTANQDDSTFTITDKVYDRTITIDLNSRGQYFDAPLTDKADITADYLSLLYNQASAKNTISKASKKNLEEIDKFISEKFKISFGNRISRQIDKFVPTYVACGGKETEAIDFLLQSKILRKFKSLNLAYLKKELNDLTALIDKVFGKGNCPMSQEFIKTLLSNQ